MIKAEEAEAALIESICSRLPGDVAPELVDQGEAFVRHFYRRVPPEDLAGRDVQDLYGAVMAAWALARHRRPGSTFVRAYNPTADEHGWQSPGTVVEIVTDDMPFLVDTVGMEIARRGYAVRQAIVPVLDVLRGADDRLVAVFGPNSGTAGARAETVMRFEIDHEAEPERLEALAEGIRHVLADVRAAVDDWPEMRRRLHEIVAGLELLVPTLERHEVAEVGAFLEWLDAGNFVFLGYREYDLVTEAGEDRLRPAPGSGLGILRGTSAVASWSFARLPTEVRSRARTPEPLILTKADSRSTVHRPAYLDYIGVKRFAHGEVCGEHRFLGLYTAAAGEANPRQIPILRGKVDRVMRRAAFAPDSHHAKALARTLESYPRDELFQITVEELFETSMGIVALAERARVRLFARGDPYKRFVSCLVFVPRDRYSTENHERIASVLRDAFGATQIDSALLLSESKLARLHFTVRTSTTVAEHDLAEIEGRIARVTRPWSNQLADALRDVHGEERGNALFRRYRTAFPVAYQADWPARAAVPDIDRAESLATGQRLVIGVYQGDEVGRSSLRCKLLSPGGRIALSDVLPIFENMGLRVGDERPYKIKPKGAGSIWMYDIGLDCAFDVDLATQETRSTFQDAFTGVWTGDLENDRLGALVLKANLTGREVSLLRALVKYVRQTGTTFSDRYLQQALIDNPGVARLLVELFGARLDPRGGDVTVARRLVAQIESVLDEIGSEHRRILGAYLSIVRATVRTNYFQRGPEGVPKVELALKLDPALMPFLPNPKPRFETFVCSPRVEGVYVRGGWIARGAVRWSERREDFRAEALELMAAETIRSAAAVPLGAKGAFVVKRPPPSGERDLLLKEAGACYRRFLSALLEVTDNVVADAVVGPPSVTRHDEDDAYLVLGADQAADVLSAGAKSVAAQHGFWLGDSFGAAGSPREPRELRLGARGAFEAVKRHLRELGMAVGSDEFTVVGIGEISGDALGSALLESSRIRLIGAFDEHHVFLDPHPDPQASLVERRRLFTTRATWRAYDRAVISDGGGVFDRDAQRIALSAQAREALDIDAEELTPDELIRALLRAPADVLWSGGAGTFIKARTESHAELFDKANDGVRIDAGELRCRVVGEASPGGITQAGRVEYALAGGRVNHDAVDGAAGTLLSDREVNLKILLDAAAGELSAAEREQLVAGVGDEMGEQVLRESYLQTIAVSLEHRQAPELFHLHARLIPVLRPRGLIGRARELQSEEPDGTRQRAQRSLTAPELAILIAQTKIALKTDLLGADLLDDEYLAEQLEDWPPPALRERLGPHMRRHRLRREIIAAELANSIVDRQGTTFVSRLAEETGAHSALIARAYAIAVAVFQMPDFWRQVGSLDDNLDERTTTKLLLEGRRLITRAARWLLHHRHDAPDIATAVSTYAAAAASLEAAVPEVLRDIDPGAWDARVREFAAPGVSAPLAMRAAAMDAVFFAFDLVESTAGTPRSIRDAARVHLALDRRLEMPWLRASVLALPRADIWQTQTRAELRDELYQTHRALTATVLEGSRASLDTDTAVEQWLDANADAVAKFLRMLTDIRATPGTDFTTLLVAVRELAKLLPGRQASRSA
jgi:glutamate dehydrogenase